jgi:hypothetical protein
MSAEFVTPTDPEELWLPESELPLKVQNLYDFGENASDDIGHMAEGEAEIDVIVPFDPIRPNSSFEFEWTKLPPALLLPPSS